MLIDTLASIVIGLEGEPERIIKKVSDLEEEYRPIMAEKIMQLPNSNSNQKPVNMKNLVHQYGDLMREKLALTFLEEAAKYAETYIPFRLRSKDANTDAWFKNSMSQVAASIRDKKKWILTPKQDTYNIFIANITSSIICIVNGNWDALERMQIVNVGHSLSTRSFFSLLHRVFRTLVIAILPLLGLIVFLLTPFADAVSGTMRDTIAILVSLWFGITVLKSIDTDFDAKFSILNDLRGFLSSNETKSKS